MNKHSHQHFNVHSITRKLFLISFFIFSTHASAAPYTPKSGDTVIATWRTKDLPPIQKQNQSEADAISLSINLLSRAKEPGQSSLYSQAQTVLAPWVNDNSDNPQLWLTWARVQQHKHLFNDAKIALEKTLNFDPSNVNAYLLLARIHIIQQNYTLATQACKKVFRHGDIATGTVCSLNAASYQGKLEQSYITLKQLLEKQPFVDHRRLWAGLILADMASRQELWSVSEQWLDNNVDNNDVSSLIEWSDIKLKLGKPEQVMLRLSTLPTTNIVLEDALLLRLALAEKKLNKNASRPWKESIKKRVALREQRNDIYHASDITTYYLDIEPNAQKALLWAKINWEQAKENKDRLLLKRAQIAFNKVGGQ